MTSIAPNQGSAGGNTETLRPQEPRQMAVTRVAGYSPDSIAVRMSTHPVPVEENHDQGVANLDSHMAQYRNTGHGVKPTSDLVGTGSKFD
ncbi:hypothetical protein FIE12Z_2682 [Fusarium flagelliforme]|uniref:Uncharacterized protein n=1 Tax=Fusarium flagelliforme TaxID=2675880 RepID=A0A395MYV4_9HYPO|nr:hypothetical protein FIE12Z_2682 [Fusarium flagelliforme]